MRVHHKRLFTNKIIKFKKTITLQSKYKGEKKKKKAIQTNNGTGIDKISGTEADWMNKNIQLANTALG